MTKPATEPLPSTEDAQPGALDAAAIAGLLDAFYAKVRADPALGPVFNGAVADWPEHMATLADFWCTVALAARRYKGNPLAVHKGLPLPPGRFAALLPVWLGLWGETVRERFAPAHAEALIAQATRIAASLEAGVAFDPARAPPFGIIKSPATSEGKPGGGS